MFNGAGTPAKVEEAAVYALLPISWIAVIARFWVRGRLTKSIGWDDFFMLLTAVLFSVYCAFMILIIDRGGFRETPLADTLPRTAIFVVLSEVFYILSTIFLKIALALFFLRVLVKKWQRVTFHIAIFLATSSGIAYAFLAIFQCGNPSQIFENIIHDKCISRPLNLGFGYFYSAINVICDLTFVVIPIFMLRGSKMDLRAKTSVAIVMCLGAVGSIASMIRLNYIAGSVFGSDFFQNASNLAFWSTIEPGVGIAAGSLATLRPLLRVAISLTRRTISNTLSGNWSQSGHKRGHSRFGSDQLRMTTFMRGPIHGYQPFDNDYSKYSYSAKISGGKAALSPPVPPKDAVIRVSSTKRFRRYDGRRFGSDSTVAASRSSKATKARHHRRYASDTTSSGPVGPRDTTRTHQRHGSSAILRTSPSSREPRHHHNRYESNSTADSSRSRDYRRHQRGRHQRYDSSTNVVGSTSSDGWTSPTFTIDEAGTIRKMVEVAITRESSTERISRHRGELAPGCECGHHRIKTRQEVYKSGRAPGRA